MAATLNVLFRRSLDIGLFPLFCKQILNNHTSPCLRLLQCVPRTQITAVQLPNLIQTASLRTNAGASSALVLSKPEQEVLLDISQENEITKDVVSKVNNQLNTNSQGRLFAVVHILGKQFKVTDEDIVVLEGYWPPTIGDKLKLEKVLLVGSSDFTLIGRPILSRELVSVEATVIEKTLSHLKTRFRKKRRKQYMRINFLRAPFTMLRINSIKITGQVNERKEVEGLEGRIF